MAKQGNWNKSFWKKLNKLGELNTSEVYNILSEEVGRVEGVLQGYTPVLYGGLKSSIYGVVVPTSNGLSGRVGYTSTPHWDLDTTGPHQDKFTNPTLAEWLIENSNKVSDNMYKIQETIDEYPIRVKERLTVYFSNGGK